MGTNENSYEQIAFSLILYAGDGRSLAMEAIKSAKKENFELASEKIEQSNKKIQQAHLLQTELIKQMEQATVSLLLVHAQDHVMNAISVKEMAEEFIDLYKRLSEKGD
ncbi:PTS lactose/cellobiose transporter subunit IIA [Alkalihalobacillus sp. 1P02AB]|uniref:PTS lactose/cellobiose transporter subunit IIA n=1 Tax=Alkalihalobacillus sp. 1P02AB TaxID=3132260 RepID=UPI0039A56389